MKHLMIDLETLDTKPGSVVLSIGAVIFTRNRIIGKCYCVLTIFPQLMKGRTISEDTVNFWKDQSGKAQDLGQAFHPESNLGELNYFIQENGGDLDKLKVWGKGPHFDMSISESLLRDFDMDVLWKFWNVRDVRTFIDYVPNKKPKDQGVAHNALDDAIYQARIIQSGLKKGE